MLPLPIMHPLIPGMEGGVVVVRVGNLTGSLVAHLMAELATILQSVDEPRLVDASVQMMPLPSEPVPGNSAVVGTSSSEYQ